MAKLGDDKLKDALKDTPVRFGIWKRTDMIILLLIVILGACNLLLNLFSIISF